jgi:hemoglobin/transferrin/lactoferrin receptor protein
MKKNLYSLLGIILFCATLSAQVITVRDNSTNDLLWNVTIKDKSNKWIQTAVNGKADVSSLAKDTLWFIHPDYFTWKGVISGEMEVRLMPRAINLNEVVLSANRSADTLKNIPFHMSIVNQKQIEFSNPQTAADLIENAGVMVQRSQAGGGSPILRGFEASRVLLVVDGVRMNNAIYRAGHLQDVMTLDASMLEKAEVVFGPSSTAYGSDALGGVMHFYTKNAQFSSDDKMLLKVNTMARYSTANKEKTGHLDFNIGLKKVSFLTNVTWSDFDDLRTGRFRDRADTAFGKRYYYVERINGKDSMLVNSDPEVQKGSGYQQLDFMQRINFKQSDKVVHGVNFQYSKNDNLPRYDRLTEFSGSNLKYAEWYYKQNRMLASYNLWLTGKTAAWDNARIILSYQKIEQDRVNRKFNNLYRTSQMEDVSVISANADFAKMINAKNDMKYGIEFTTNDVQSAAEKRNVVVDTAGKTATRYPDGGSKFMTMAAYITDNYKINDQWNFAGGLRFNIVNLKSTFTDTTFFPFPFKEAEQKSMALTGNAGLIFKPGNHWQVNTLFSTGFRAPNVDDLTKVFETGGGILIVANPDLKPEYTYNAEIGVNKVFNDKFKINAVFFHTTLTNAMVLKDFKYNGSDSVMYNGSLNKVQAMQNANTAFVYGYNMVVAWDIDQNFALKSMLNYTRGTYYLSDVRQYIPLDHIAPLQGQTGLSYKTKKFEGEIFSRYSAAKKLADYSPSGEDNLQYATASGMPGWWTLNIRTGFQVVKNLRATIAVENITDNHYRVFASGISSPGRNFIFSLRYKL